MPTVKRSDNMDFSENLITNKRMRGTLMFRASFIYLKWLYGLTKISFSSIGTPKFQSELRSATIYSNSYCLAFRNTVV